MMQLEDQLVIAIETPSLWLTRPRDSCIYVYMTAEIALVSPDPPHHLCYSFTHADRSIGYRNRNPHPLWLTRPRD